MKGSQTSKRMGWHGEETDMATGKDTIYSIPPTHHPPKAQDSMRQWGLDDKTRDKEETLRGVTSDPRAQWEEGNTQSSRLLCSLAGMWHTQMSLPGIC